MTDFKLDPGQYVDLPAGYEPVEIVELQKVLDAVRVRWPDTLDENGVGHIHARISHTIYCDGMESYSLDMPRDDGGWISTRISNDWEGLLAKIEQTPAKPVRAICGDCKKRLPEGSVGPRIQLSTPPMKCDFCGLEVKDFKQITTYRLE